MRPAWLAGRARRAYLLASIVVISGFVLLPAEARRAAFLLVAIGATLAILAGWFKIAPSERRPWSLLLASLIVVNIADVLALLPGVPAAIASEVVDAASNALILAAAVVLVMRQGRNNIVSSSTPRSSRWPSAGCCGTPYWNRTSPARTARAWRS